MLKRRAISRTARIPIAAITAGRSVSGRLRDPPKMPVPSPTPKKISTSPQTAVLRKLRLNWPTAMISVGMPKR